MTVTLAEARLHLRVTGTAEDTLITDLLSAAVAHVERITGLALNSRNAQKSTKNITSPVRLFPHPVTAVTAIEVLPAVGTARNVAAFFDTDLTSRPAIVRRVDGIELARGETLRVSFTAGFAEWPSEISQAVLQLVAHWYESREAVQSASMSEVPLSVSRLLSPWLGLRLA